jgi:hypothetical protein
VALKERITTKNNDSQYYQILALTNTKQFFPVKEKSRVNIYTNPGSGLKYLMATGIQRGSDF